MSESIMTSLDNLIQLFNTAKQGQRDSKPLETFENLFKKIDGVKSLSKVGAIMKAKQEIESAREIFSAWKIVGYQTSFLRVQRQLESARKNLQRFLDVDLAPFLQK